jgi:hypothetical protein
MYKHNNIATFENLKVGDRIAKTQHPRKNWWIVTFIREIEPRSIRVIYSRRGKHGKTLHPLHFTIYRWYKVFPRNLAPRANVSKGEINHETNT